MKRLIIVLLFAFCFTSCMKYNNGNKYTNDKSEFVTSNINESGDIPMEYIKNSDTNELISDFSYLWLLESNNENINSVKTKDIVTLTLLFHEDDRPKLWIVDVKSRKLYYSISLDYFYNINEATFNKNLTNEDINCILNKIDDINIQSWEKNYTGTDKGTGSFSWSVKIEYNNGVIESHSGSGMTVAPPEGYYDIKSLLENLCK